jgi:hypothetical protein
MKARLGKHLRTQFVGYVALFLALGTSTAFALNVDSGDVENNTIKSKDLKNGKAVKTDDVQDGSLLCQDFSQGQPACQAGDGVGLTNLTVRSNSATVGTGGTVDVDCAPGERATGGGASTGNGPVAQLTRPLPSEAGATPTGWRATNPESANLTVTVWVICAS